MKKYMQVLKKSKLFSGISEEDISAMLHCLDARILRYNKDEYVFRQGNLITDISILVDGTLHIQGYDYWGNCNIINAINSGELFGESYALSTDAAILNDVIAIEDSTIILLDARKIISVCSSNCKFHSLVVQNLFHAISEKNIHLVQKLKHIQKRSTREKLISYLSAESVKQNSPVIYIPFNRQQLADFLSVDRSAMSNELCKMRDDGLIKFKKNKFELI